MGGKLKIGLGDVQVIPVVQGTAKKGWKSQSRSMQLHSRCGGWRSGF